MNNRLTREKVINYLKEVSQEEQYTNTKVARNEIIKGCVEAELMALNKEFRKVKANEMQKWKHSNLDIYKTKYFKDFIYNKNEEHTSSYRKLLKTCIINQDTIEGFLSGDNSPQVKTKDFFVAFINYVEKKYNHLIISNVVLPKASMVEIKKTEPLGYDNQKTTSELFGAQLINEYFFNQIRKLKFTQGEFFSAKHDDRCQWYGIVKNWYVQRKIYTEIYQKLIVSFDTYKVNKVAAVITGEGGVGKSLLQMRLAHDLVKLGDYKILWVNDFEEFMNLDSKSGISSWKKVKNDISSNYFLFIEDWYSNVDTRGVLSSRDFLEDTKKCNHVRIVVGDRYIEGKRVNGNLIQENTYIDYLYDDDNRFEIPLEENRFIIQEILKKIPKWEKVIKANFDYELLNKAPLFMLLFIIAKASENNSIEPIDLAEPQVEFRKIIKSHLKKLEDLNCTGIAKALYYWSFIYSKFRILISYDSLLILAQHFRDPGDEDLLKYKNLNIKGKVTEILNSFIGIRLLNQVYNQKLFYFNHDILSDYGLSKVVYPGWKSYDEVVLKTILEVFTDKAPQETASVFLHRIIRLNPSLFEDRDEILYYIDKLIERKIKHPDYSGFFSNKNVIPLSIEELDGYATRLFAIGHFNKFFWSYVFAKNELKDKWSSVFLENFSISDSPQAVVALVISLQKNKKNKVIQSIYKQVLSNDVLLINPDLVISAIKHSNNECLNLVQGAIKKVLQADFKQTNVELVTSSINCYQNKQDKLIQSFCKDILQDNILLLNSKLVIHAIKFISDEFKGLVQDACNKILEADFKKIDSGLVSIAINFHPNKQDKLVKLFCERVLLDEVLLLNPHIVIEAIKHYNDPSSSVFQAACQKILGANFNEIYPGLVCSVIKVIDNSENDLVQKACSKVLVLDKLIILKFDPMLISTAFYYFNNKKVKLEIAKYFILQKSNDAKYSSVVYRSLEFFAYQAEIIPEDVHKYVDAIITDFHKHEKLTNKKKIKYYSLLKLPFHSNDTWKNQTKKILDKWQDYSPLVVSCVLFGYRNSYKQQIKKTCLEILNAWKKEINVEIKAIDGEIQYANHFIIALGHPDLQKEVLLIAKHINKEMLKGFKVNDYVSDIVKEIIQNKNYPIWGENRKKNFFEKI